LVSNLLLIVMIGLIPGVFVPHNKKVELTLQAALQAGKITPDLSATLADRKNRTAHLVEESIVLVVAALMVLKPF
jgi:hypothetical protein